MLLADHARDNSSLVTLLQERKPSMKFRPTTGGMLRKDKMGEKGQAGDTERTSCRYYDGLKKGTWSTETFSITIITTTSSVMRKVCRLSSKVKGSAGKVDRTAGETWLNSVQKEPLSTQCSL